MRAALALIRRALIQLLLLPIRLYRLAISPLLPKVCRFHPSCSVYAMGAIAVHGPLKGSYLAARRISRCHPFNAGGLDPVPPRDGHPADELLAESAPAIAKLLTAPPPPHLGAVLPPDFCAHPSPPTKHEAP